MQFSIFLNDLTDEIEHTVIKFADNIKLEGCMRTVEDSIKITNLSKHIEDTNKISFSEDKRNILYIEIISCTNTTQVTPNYTIIN